MKPPGLTSIRYITLFFALILASLRAYGQSVSLQYDNIPLNEVLLDLNDRHNTQVSVNSQLSTHCTITVNRSFESMEQALEFMAKRCELTLRKVSGVYIFQSHRSSKNPEEITASTELPNKLPTYLYQGQVVELDTGEPLPFASIQLPDKKLVADESGRFSFKSLKQKESAKISSLGYWISDTTLSESSQLTIILRPRAIELKAVEVSGVNESASTHIGENAGQISFSNVGNSLVPGISNNLIFNNLRLYPGIMAAGESIADYVIWGSYAGQNHVIYDGITLFNSWGINDDIGRVNPYIIKNVELYKGGYNVPYGDRIGGVILINGKRGQRKRAEGNISLTNQLANIYVNIPMLNHNSSLQIAGRKTYFDFLDLSRKYKNRDEVIVPTYDYADFNLKFSTVFDNSDRLEISSINSSDSYEGRIRDRQPGRRFQDIMANSEQFGNSIHYTKNWTRGGLTSFLLSQSYYSPNLTTNFLFRQADESGVESDVLRTDEWENPVEEYSTRITHQFSLNQMQQLSLNGSYIMNETAFRSDFTENLLETDRNRLTRFSFHLYDRISFSDQFFMQLGVKADMPTSDFKVYWQPRVNGQLSLTDHWNINFGWGMYNQFIARNAVLDELGNRYDVWNVAQENGIPVLSARHNVLGTSFITDNFELNIEGYLKNTDAVSRYLLEARLGNQMARLLRGSAKVRGIDVFVKKKVQAHEFQLSYTLSEVKEQFDVGRRLPRTHYRDAPQSQLHEIKSVAALNFTNIRLSLTQVHGSGFSNVQAARRESEIVPYWRTDAAFQYLFEVEQLQFKTGVSILNIFNHENVRLNQSVNIPNGAVINTLGIPFTPTFYLDCQF